MGSSSDEDESRRNSSDDNSDRDSDEDDSPRDSDEDEDDSQRSGSDNSDDSDKDSDNSDEDESNSDEDDSDRSGSSNSDSEDSSSNKKKKVKPFKSKDPFVNAMTDLNDILMDLDQMSFQIDSICMQHGLSQTKWHPPAKQESPQGPPRNYYAPGLSAGEKKKRSQKKRIVVQEESSLEEDEESIESDIAPTLSHNGTDNVIPYCEPREDNTRFAMPPQAAYQTQQPAYDGLYANYMRPQTNNYMNQQQTRFSNVGNHFQQPIQMQKEARTYSDLYRQTNSVQSQQNPFLQTSYQQQQMSMKAPVQESPQRMVHTQQQQQQWRGGVEQAMDTLLRK